jgi:hypothetical protein
MGNSTFLVARKTKMYHYQVHLRISIYMKTEQKEGKEEAEMNYS